MAMILKQSTAVDVLIGPFVDITNGATAETGETPTVKLSKNGQTLAAKNDVTTPVSDADGYYNCELDATDTNTVGLLTLTVAASATALPVRHEFQVLEEAIYDALYGASAAAFDGNADVTVGSIAASAITATAIATDAITAAKIAANAIGASELATDAVEEIADQVWDEVLTGATHNVVNSAGRRLRQLETGIVLHSGTLDAATSNTADLETGAASTVDKFYDHNLLVTTGGTGAGQARVIVEYDGTTNQRATVAPPWAVTPDNTTTYDVVIGYCHAETNSKTVTVGLVAAATTSTVTLASNASAVDDFYNNDVLIIDAGTGEGQARIVTDYNGTTKVATIAPNWITTPDTTSEYIIEEALCVADVLSIQASALASINTEVDTALTDIGLDHLVSAAVVGADVIDNSIMARLVSSSATADWDSFDNTSDALQALRDRGDAAWTTGAGGSPPHLLQSTTIATLASQSSFTLTAGSADDNAYNGAIAVITDQVTAVQKAVGTVSDYVGSTRTITLSADPGIYTMAVGDTIEIMAALGSAGSAPTADQVADAVWEEAQVDHTTAGTFGEIATEIAAVKIVTDALPDGGALTTIGGNVDAILVDTGTTIPASLATIDGNVDAILVDTGVSIPAGIAALNDLSAAQVNAEIDTALVDYDAATGAEVAALNDLSAAQVNAEMVDALNVDTYAEPTGVPSTTASLVDKLGHVQMALVNQVTVTATKKQFFDAGGTAEFEKDLSDDGTTYTETAVNAP